MKLGAEGQALKAVSSLVLLMAAGTCRTSPGNGGVGSLLGPGSGALLSVRTPEPMHERVLWRRTLGADSGGRPLAHLRTTERLLAPDSSLVEIVTVWSAPYDTTDSLVFDRRSLAPVSESYRSRGLRYEYRYNGSSVSGFSQRTDSAVRRIDRNFGAPPFAFNQVDVLVRSLVWRFASPIVVPLFSEADMEVEHDTLSVLGDTTIDGSTHARILRFADPAIVTRFVVRTAPPAILDARTRRRRSGTVLDLR